MNRHTPSGKMIAVVLGMVLFMSLATVLAYLVGRFVLPLPHDGYSLGYLWWYFIAALSGGLLVFAPFLLHACILVEKETLEHGRRRGVAVAVLFGFGFATVLAFVGVVAAGIGILGRVISHDGAQIFSAWLSVFAGLLTYLTAMGHIGLLPLSFPYYKGPTPAFLRRAVWPLRSLFFGAFTALIGIGGVYPALVLLFSLGATSSRPMEGTLLLLTHALGLLFVLLVVAFFSHYRLFPAEWVIVRRRSLGQISAWIILVSAAVLIAHGLFVPLSGGVGLLGQLLSLGFPFLALLILCPVWFSVFRTRRRLSYSLPHEIARIHDATRTLEEERRRIDDLLIPEGSIHQRHFADILTIIDVLDKERCIAEEAARWRILEDPRGAYQRSVLVRSLAHGRSRAFLVTGLIALLILVAYY